MRARTFALACLSLLCFAACLTAGQTGDDKKKDAAAKKEPDHISADTEVHGKNLEQWIKLIPSKDRSLTKAAIEASMLYGPDLAQKAVPAMIAELKKHNPPNATLDISVRTTIPQPLALILSSVKNPNPQDVKDAVGLMKKMLKDPQVIVKLRVEQAVAQMGPMAKETIPELIHLVKDPYSESWELRHAAIVALGTVGYEEKGGPQPQVVSTLYTGLADTAIKTRLAAIQSLNFLHVGQEPSLKAKFLAEMQKRAKDDTDPFCRLRAHMTVYTVLEKPADKTKERELISKLFLGHADHQVRMEACQAFGLMGDEAKDQVPHLIGMLSDRDFGVVAIAIVALAAIKDNRAVSPLQGIVENAGMPELVRNTAKDAIEILSGNTKKEEPKKGGGKK